MLPAVLNVTSGQARRFLLRALGLATPFPDIASALAHHGFIQLDPINVCGRMHDLILRNRVAGYREGDLLRFMHGSDPARPPAPEQRRAFEHYFDVLAALPVEAWPYLIDSMHARAHRPSSYYWGRLTAREETLARHIVDAIGERGPLSSDDIEHDDRALTAWNSTARFAKVVLEKMFVHGRVLISTRRVFRRVYDLPQRVLPASVLNAPTPSAAEAHRWRVLTRLRQRRLVRLGRTDLAMVDDRVQPVRIDGGPVVYCLQEDTGLLEAPEDATPTPRANGHVHLLAPLDPLIYDRTLTRRLWDFDYTWEVYTPPAKRVRGYYALPVLAGETIVGHVDPKADRDRGRLRVVSRRVSRGVRTAPAVTELARFLGLR